MQIESLQVFCDLTETESFTRTAKLHSVTQSAVSQQISTLERLFNSRLIERSKRHFRLTREGQVLYEMGKRIIGAYEALHSQMQEIKNVISGTVRIATVESLGLHTLPSHLKRYMQSFPTVNLHVAYRRANKVYEDVVGNVVDVGLVACPARDARLECVPLGQELLVLVCPPDHPLAKSRTLRLSALHGQRFVAFKPDLPTRKAIDAALRENGVVTETVMELDNVETMKRAVEVGIGLAILPLVTVTAEVAAGTLAAVRFGDATLERPWAAVYKKSRVPTTAMRELLNLLKSGVD